MSHLLHLNIHYQEKLFILLLFSCLSLSLSKVCAKNLPISDLVTIVNQNQLVGYGVVAGLKGTGDSRNSSSQHLLTNIFNSFPYNINLDLTNAVNSKQQSVAVVLLTANVPVDYKIGMRFDLTITSLGDAKSLHEGYLLMTPLLGSDQEVYALSQGAISPVDAAGKKHKKSLTSAMIKQGAILEREVPKVRIPNNSVKLLLRQRDGVSTEQIVSAINKRYPDTAQALDYMTLKIYLSTNTNIAEFLTQIFSLKVKTK